MSEIVEIVEIVESVSHESEARREALECWQDHYRCERCKMVTAMHHDQRRLVCDGCLRSYSCLRCGTSCTATPHSPREKLRQCAKCYMNEFSPRKAKL